MIRRDIEELHRQCGDETLKLVERLQRERSRTPVGFRRRLRGIAATPEVVVA